MTDSFSQTSSTKKMTLEDKVRLTFVAVAFFTLPYAAVILMINGMNPLNVFLMYWKACIVTGALIGGLTALVLAVLHRWPSLAAEPPELPENVLLPVIALSFVPTVLAGVWWGWQTGAALFWPHAFAVIVIAHTINWAMHQLRIRGIIR